MLTTLVRHLAGHAVVHVWGATGGQPWSSIDKDAYTCDSHLWNIWQSKALWAIHFHTVIFETFDSPKHCEPFIFTHASDHYALRKQVKCCRHKIWKQGHLPWGHVAGRMEGSLRKVLQQSLCGGCSIPQGRLQCSSSCSSARMVAYRNTNTSYRACLHVLLTVAVVLLWQLSQYQELAGIVLTDDPVVWVSRTGRDYIEWWSCCLSVRKLSGIVLSDDPVFSVSGSGRDCVDWWSCCPSVKNW